MTSLLKLAHRPAVSIPETATVTQAVQVMVEGQVSSAVVVCQGGVSGMLTERDLVLRVVREGRDPRSTLVRDVMSPSVFTLNPDASPEMAIQLMDALHIRHLPVVDPDGSLVAVVSMTRLMRVGIDELHRSVDSLQGYIGADGIGG